MTEISTAEQQIPLKWVYEGAKCSCDPDEGHLQWCLVHGVVIHSKLLWSEVTESFLPITNKVVSSDGSQLRDLRHVKVPKCRCLTHENKDSWYCPVHGFQTICNCRNEWYMDHVCPTHGFVPRSDGSNFLASNPVEDNFRDVCLSKVRDIGRQFAGLDPLQSEEVNPCTECDEFPDGCRDRCPHQSTTL